MTLLTIASAPVPEPSGTGVPFSSTTPAEVRVHLLPEASVRVPPVVGLSSFGVGVGVGVGVDAAGSGLVVVPGPGDHGALGLVLPHHQPLAFSCQTSPLTYASSVTLLVVVSAVPLTAT